MKHTTTIVQLNKVQ